MANGKAIQLDDWNVRAVLWDDGTLTVFVLNEEAKTVDLVDDTYIKEVHKVRFAKVENGNEN